jgi:transposase
MKKELLSISYKINSIYGNHNDKNIYKHLNVLTNTIRDWIDLFKKNTFDLDSELELIKKEREQIHPDQENTMFLYDLFIEEVERLLFQSKKG